jgi:ubiquinone/menaquinone biosynthesis C-methylase UbiE
MQHRDHVNLLRGAVPLPGGTWADLGSGRGAFTLALAELVGPQGLVYSADKDESALREQAQAMRARFPAISISYLTADFTRPLDLPPLDGIVMANALHFVEPRQKLRVVELVRSYLRPGGRLVVVEYNVDTGNFWVPFPLTYLRWEVLARQAGFSHTELLATAASQFLKGFYSALNW